MCAEADYDLTAHNGYGIRATVERAFLPTTPEELVESFQTDPEREKVLLGRGYNVILSRERYEGVDFVIVAEKYSRIERQGRSGLEVLSGTDMRDVADFAASAGLAGLEVFCDIPSSAGGAVYMNASSSGLGLEGSLTSIRALMLDGMKWRDFGYQEIEPGYRHSVFQRDRGVVSALTFDLVKDVSAAIRGRMEEIRARRHAKQPVEYPNAGSVFKRPPGRYVGPMVEELGLKGFRIGGAMVSEKHAGFIVNVGGATGADVLAVVDEVRHRVKMAFGVDLELEQRVL